MTYWSAAVNRTGPGVVGQALRDDDIAIRTGLSQGIGGHCRCGINRLLKTIECFVTIHLDNLWAAPITSDRKQQRRVDDWRSKHV
jgi:hypothetical protein